MHTEKISNPTGRCLHPTCSRKGTRVTYDNIPAGYGCGDCDRPYGEAHSHGLIVCPRHAHLGTTRAMYPA